MEILPGVHRITDDLGGLPLHLFFLMKEDLILIDSGTRYSPDTVIQPYLQDLKLEVGDIKVLVVTHGHDDHCGGNVAIKRMAPSIEIMAHRLDVSWIEDHQLLFDEVYGPYSKYLQNLPELEEAFFNLIGKEEILVDHIIEGSHYALKDSQDLLELIHTPGHTPGQMILYDHINKIAFVSDAIQGRGLEINGKFYWPIYMDVDQYLQTLRTIKSLSPQYIFPAHYESKQGTEVIRFVDDSIDFVEKTDRDILEILQQSSQPLNLELISRTLLDRWPGYEISVELFTVCAAHLRRFHSKGQIMKQNDLWYPA